MRTLLLAFLVVPGCVHPSFRATRIVELELPVTGLTALDCESHNGAITVNGDEAATKVSLRAELSVRGYTQQEADANLALLEVVPEQVGGTLRVRGKYPQRELNDRSPSFAFTLTVPPRLSLALVSHNGELRARGVEGDARFETHNGDIDASLRTNRVAATTHNGDVELRLDGSGALDGQVTSHNGDVSLTLASALGTRVDATTHNGRVTPPANASASTSSRRHWSGTVGDGAGKLLVDTHNGDVVLR